ncbi:MAG TPA: hypothetical protein VMT51_05970 [Dongiaceae bacterium]|nr:hypothetical protein [Dongiaceae bacterium]
MQIPSTNNLDGAAQAEGTATSAKPTTKGAAPRSSSSQTLTVPNAVAQPQSIQEANVTFRRDANGQIYYVFSDAETGRELQEVPPEEVRKVGQGIAEYLKQQEQKPRVETKA